MAYPVERLRGRYRMMAWLEALNGALVPFAVFGLLDCPPSLANVVGALVVSALLAVGAAYWAVKLRQLDRRTPLPEGLGAFAVLRVVSWALCGVAFGIAVGAGVRGAAAAHWVPGLALALFAVLEQVNYFHVQLSHDNVHDLRRLARSGLRRSKLARDLAARHSGRPVPGLRFPPPRQDAPRP